MGKNIKNQSIYKSIGIISYVIFSLLGLSILFNFSPRELLFTNSYIDELKRSLFKDFVKMVYDNINTPLIKKIQFSVENESCPEGFETLYMKHQYYGNFSKFYGNASFCLQRYNSSEYTYEKLLQNAEYGCGEGKKRCGKLNRILNLPLCINIGDNCPLNDFDFGNRKANDQEAYPIPENTSYLLPYYGDNQDLSAIINIEVINNEKLCLEKFNREQNLLCEFPDNNQCFIFVSFNVLSNLDLSENRRLYPRNLLKWNLKNFDESAHNFCKEKLVFHILASGYFNFNYQNLQDFKREFPKDKPYSNSLYLTSQAYKENNNIDLLFYLISFIILSFSILHLIFQILVYFDIKSIRKIYIYFGHFLFTCKLFSYFGMIIYHFWFYLKIKKVYITLIDEPLKTLLKEYNSTRKKFIEKICIFLFIGFLIICIDLIILTFTVKVQWGRDIIINSSNSNLKKEELNDEEEEENDEDYSQISSKKQSNINNINNKFDQRPNYTLEASGNNIENKFTNEGNFVIKNENDSFENNDKIRLQFVCKEAPATIYELEAKKKEYFKDLIGKLKEKYDELKGKNLRVFNYESKIININQKLEDIGISENVKIVMISD